MKMNKYINKQYQHFANFKKIMLYTLNNRETLLEVQYFIEK